MVCPTTKIPVTTDTRSRGTNVDGGELGYGSVDAFVPQPFVQGLKTRSIRPVVRHRSAPKRIPRAMFHVRVLTVGRRTVKEQWAEDATDEYILRLRPVMEVEAPWIRNDDALISQADADASRGAVVVALDETGHQPRNSTAFSSWLYRQLENGGSRMTFVVGGADGLPPSFRKRVPLISLGNLTVTHKYVQLHKPILTCPAQCHR
mmetsp:Transcript_18165/g.37844  ORF Transcript_18165/g.37844 Transcript_18165/m.37844 type:complete len:205 (-) Transcript_18165:4478-5092(-)